MKFAVSSLALALSLSLVSPALAQTAPTAADADKFVAAAEKELGDFTIFNAQVSWINQTYITDDTDAVAARVGAQGTELGVRYATEAAKYR
jgi:peptidyl-dipeptidase A